MNRSWKIALGAGTVLGGLILFAKGAKAMGRSGKASIIVAPTGPNVTYRDGTQVMPYQTTLDDWLWVIRSTVQEGPPADHPYIIWSMIQRFVAFRQTGRKLAGSLGELVQYFSQPVNPHWVNGTGPAAGLIEAGDPRMTARKIAERREYRARSWEWFDDNEPALVDLIDAHILGEASNPFPAPWRDCDNFANNTADHEAVAAGRAYRPVPDGNIYHPDSPPLVGPVELR